MSPVSSVRRSPSPDSGSAPPSPLLPPSLLAAFPVPGRPPDLASRAFSGFGSTSKRSRTPSPGAPAERQRGTHFEQLTRAGLPSLNSQRQADALLDSLVPKISTCEQAEDLLNQLDPIAEQLADSHRLLLDGLARIHSKLSGMSLADNATARAMVEALAVQIRDGLATRGESETQRRDIATLAPPSRLDEFMAPVVEAAADRKALKKTVRSLREGRTAPVEPVPRGPLGEALARATLLETRLRSDRFPIVDFPQAYSELAPALAADHFWHATTALRSALVDQLKAGAAKVPARPESRPGDQQLVDAVARQARDIRMDAEPVHRFAAAYRRLASMTSPAERDRIAGPMWRALDERLHVAVPRGAKSPVPLLALATIAAAAPRSR